MPEDALEAVEDLLLRLKMTKAERSRLAKSIYCPSCEAPLSVFDRVLSYDDEQLRDMKRWSLWRKNYAPQFRKFHRFLLNHPSLGGLHPLGQKLAEAVKQARIRIVDPTTWHRALSFNRKLQLSLDSFLPRNTQHAGRYNHAGQFAFYVADRPETAAVEKLDDARKGMLWVAKVKLHQRLKVLNVTIPFTSLGNRLLLPLLLEGLVFEGSLREPVRENRWAPEQYHVPRYVADLVRRRGLDGILYTSSKEFPFKPDVFGTNLVIINSNFRKFISIEEYGLYRRHEATFCEPFNLPTMKLEKIS